MKVVILADNQGDSLQPLTSSLSFVKLELLGEPLLFYILDSLFSLDAKEDLEQNEDNQKKWIDNIEHGFTNTEGTSGVDADTKD